MNATGQATLEQAVIAVCGDVLGRTGIGPTDEFGELCADLSVAVRVTTLLNQLLGAELTVMRLFSEGTPRRLAATLGSLGIAAPPITTRHRAMDDVDRRQRYWETTYRFRNPNQQDRFNTAGWTDSASLTSLPEQYMREWTECTVARIRGLRPRRVLDIGCGVGLILFRLAAECERYVGVDFSSVAVEQVGNTLAAERGFDHVDVAHADALQAAELTAETYDLVLLNSVVQYFPDIDYLAAVLSTAVRRLASGGTLLLGDIRHRDLHHAMRVSAAAGSDDDTPVELVRLVAEQATATDSPLLLAPWELCRIAGTTGADLSFTPLVRRGSHPTEMNRFRYDVLLTVDDEPAPRPDTELRWHPQHAGSLAQLLDSTSGSLVLRQVPDARNFPAVRLAKAVDTAPAGSTMGQLRRSLGAMPSIDPEETWELGHRKRFGVAIGPSDVPGLVDVAFHRGHDDRATARLLTRACPRSSE